MVGVALATTCVGTVIVTGVVPVQPFASSAVIVCGPALTPLKLPLASKNPPSSSTGQSRLPPVALALTLPVPPKRLGLVGVALATTCVGTVIITGVVPVQPLASSAVIVCGPALLR